MSKHICTILYVNLSFLPSITQLLIHKLLIAIRDVQISPSSTLNSDFIPVVFSVHTMQLQYHVVLCADFRLFLACPHCLLPWYQVLCPPSSLYLFLFLLLFFSPSLFSEFLFRPLRSLSLV